jgi:Protein of unknown function (DUF935)
MADDEAPRLYVEPPIPVSTEFSSIPQVRSVIDQHISGRFRMSALLTERMLMNPRLRGAMGTRLAGLLATEVRFEPVRQNRDARRAAREFSEDFPAMVTTPVRKQYRKWSILLGLSIGQRALRLSPTSGRHIYKLRTYWPGFANWYWAEGGYRIQTTDAGAVDAASPGMVDVGAPSPTLTGLINPSEQPWVIDEPNGENSWREAMILAAWRPWLGHEWASRDQNRNSEKNGIGAVKLKYPRGEGPQHKEALLGFAEGVRTMGSEGSIPCEQREQGKPSFDVEPFEFNGTGGQAISDALGANAVALAILFLGHNLTTEIKGGGSYAAAGVGEYIRDDIKHDDAAAEWAVFGPQLARPYCLLNYGDPELAPRARYITDSMAVNRAMAQMFQSIATAIQYLRVNVPRFDVDAFCEQWRIPQLPLGSVQVPAALPPTPPTAPTSIDVEDDDDDTEEAA